MKILYLCIIFKFSITSSCDATGSISNGTRWLTPRVYRGRFTLEIRIFLSEQLKSVRGTILSRFFSFFPRSSRDNDETPLRSSLIR